MRSRSAAIRGICLDDSSRLAAMPSAWDAIAFVSVRIDFRAGSVRMVWMSLPACTIWFEAASTVVFVAEIASDVAEISFLDSGSSSMDK